MSATDRIRDAIRAQRNLTADIDEIVDEIVVRADLAEALCDLADVCREHQALTDALAAEQRGPDELTQDEAERVAALTERQRAALSRIGGEGGDG